MKIGSYNTEYVVFSPDFRYILRYGDDVTEVYETETGSLAQSIFDADNVKYDKQKRIKNSGLGSAGWIINGKYLFACDFGGGFFKVSRTISFWKVKK
jgi:hypothetical protein